jgi:hypothetical protein
MPCTVGEAASRREAERNAELNLSVTLLKNPRRRAFWR